MRDDPARAKSHIRRLESKAVTAELHAGLMFDGFDEDDAGRSVEAVSRAGSASSESEEEGDAVRRNDRQRGTLPDGTANYVATPVSVTAGETEMPTDDMGERSIHAPVDPHTGNLEGGRTRQDGDQGGSGQVDRHSQGSTTLGGVEEDEVEVLL